MINKVINGWWVLNLISTDLYKCQLTCGCIRKISGIDLRNGNTPMCNCRIGTTKRYLYGGKEYTISQLSKICGLNKSTLRRRIDGLGWDITRALTTPLMVKVDNKKRRTTITEVEYQNTLYMLSELAIIYDVPYHTLRYRINAGWPVETAIQRDGKYRGKGGTREHTAYELRDKYTIDDIEYSLEEITYKFKISSKTFLRRIAEGMSPNKAVTYHPGKGEEYEYNGEIGHLGYFAKKYGINKATLHTRIKSGWGLEEALSRLPLAPKERRFGRTA